MTLTYSHSALWKHYRDQTTIIHVVNVVRAKGAFDDVACKNIYFCRRPLQNSSMENIASMSILHYISC